MRILEEGEKLFIKYGPEGTKMRTLAENVNISLANLYNYISSKRELWFAIRKKKLLEYIDAREKALKPYKSSLVDLTEKWGEFFLDYAAEDYERYRMIWSVTPPSGDQVGPIEKDFLQTKLLDRTINHFREAFQAEKLELDEIYEYFYFLSIILFGGVDIEKFLKFRNSFYKEKPPDLPLEKFRKYILKKLRHFAEENLN